MTAPAEQFKSALRDRGIIPPAQVTVGQIDRADVDGTNGKGDASYVYFDDGIPAGGFENHRDGAGWQNWKADIGRKLSFAENQAQRERIAAAQREREADDERRRAVARERAAAIWMAAAPTDGAHPYLARKVVMANGMRLHNGALVVPVRDAGGVLHSLQFIDADGIKRFLTDGRTRGCYFAIGKPGERICIAEGYATSASIHEATGYAVAVAFDAGNLGAVAEAIKAKYPAATLILCADDDYRTAGNPGLTKATEAALAVGGFLAVPDFGADRPDDAKDFNDLAQHRGREAVERAIANARAPDVSAQQPDAPDAPGGDPDGIRTPRVLRLDELLMLDIQEREQVLSPWLLTQSLNMIHAWRGVGKTHIALGIAYAVATGGSFLNWRASSARPVLYIDGEMPAAAIKGRLAALVEQDERDFDPTMLSIITPDVQEGPMPDLATVEGQLQIERVIGPAMLIIVDNISTLVRSGGAENDAESWRSVGEWALGQRRLGRSVLFVHHSAKGGQQRGSSKREDTLDVVIKLVRPSDYLPEQGARFEVHFEKYRNGTGDEAKSIEAHLSTDPHGTPTWTWRDADESTFDRVVALTRDGLNGREIAEELNINKSNVSRHLARARSLGLVTVPTK